MKNIYKPIFNAYYLLVFVVAFYSCKESNLPFIEASKDSSLKEMRLGESDLYIYLPEKFKLEEARGKEGQLGYGIEPLDTSIRMSGFIEIQYGDPIGKTYRGGRGKLIAISKLLDKNVEWIMENPFDGYLRAYTDERGDFNADVSARTRKEIDSLISWVSTLKTK